MISIPNIRTNVLVVVIGNRGTSKEFIVSNICFSIGRHSKSLDIERKRCGYCYGKFEVLLNKKTRDGKIQSVPSTPGKANGFALFVKENYADTKSPNLTHAEVMKLLGQKFAELKIAKSN